MGAGKTLSFIRQFLRHPTQTGAVAPSSRGLVRAMLAPVDFDKARNIVELGPGTGPFTRALLARMRPDARLHAVEINPEFCRELGTLEDKRLNVIQGDAQRLSSIVPRADYILSGLPMVGFSREVHDAILNEIAQVAPVYIQFHYSTLAEKMLRKHFKSFTRKVVLLNVPPAIVYTVKV